MASVSKAFPIILYLRDVDILLFRSQKLYRLFQKMLQKLSGPILILGSRITRSDSNDSDIDDMLVDLFPYNIEIKPPEDETHLVSWKSQLEEDMKMIQCQDNKNHIIEVLAANDVECDDLGSINVEDTLLLSKYIEEIVVSAISYHLMNNKHEYRNGKLLISSQRSAVISIFGVGFFLFPFWLLGEWGQICSSFVPQHNLSFSLSWILSCHKPIIALHLCVVEQFVSWTWRVPRT